MNTEIKTAAQLKTAEILLDVSIDLLDSLKTMFPNGFASWYETHHEVVTWLHEKISADLLDLPGGTGQAYEIAKDVTDKFEARFKGFEWDGDFFDAVEKFCEEEILDMY